MSKFQYLLTLIEKKIKNCLDIKLIEQLSNKELRETVDKNFLSKLCKKKSNDILKTNKDYNYLGNYYIVYSNIMGIGPIFTTKQEAEEYNKVKYNGTHIISEYINIFTTAEDALKAMKNVR